MALKGFRYEGETDLGWFMNETATRGGIACISTGGSGVAMDQDKALVTYSASMSGQVPVGILLNDMVDKDLTRTHINFQKNEVQKGGKVTLLKKGTIVTDMIDPGTTPAAGDLAYVGPSGYIRSDYMEGAYRIGQFDSIEDEDGYAKVSVNLPGQPPNRLA